MTHQLPPLTPETIAKMFNCPVENVLRQYARNAASLREMEAKARESGKKYRGYTADEHADMAAKFEKIAKGEIHVVNR